MPKFKSGNSMKLQKNPYKVHLGTVDIYAFDDPDANGGIFSNYAYTPIKMPIKTKNKGNITVEFHTVEHYFQYMKDPTNDAYLNLILSSKDPQHARNAGQTRMGEILKPQPNGSLTPAQIKWRQNWGFRSEQVMKEAIDAKFAQHKEFRDELEKTGNACLVEDTGTRRKKNRDGKWGFKLGGKTDTYTDGMGEVQSFEGNLLGRMLMEKRNEIHRAKGNHSLVVNPSQVSNEVKQVMQKYYKGKSLIVSGNSYDIDRQYYAAKLPGVVAIPSHKPAKPASKTLSTSHRHTLFSKTKPQPDRPEVKAASNTLVTEIKAKDKKAIGAASDCIIRKGNINDTFKVGFTNAVEAQIFFDRLQAKCAELGIISKDITYHKNDLYPMNEEGRVVPPGDKDAKFSHIVRFEVSTDALKYLDKLSVEKSLYQTIMGKTPSKKLRM